MKFYLVRPKEKYSPSRRWFVDELGLGMVKEKYTHYNKDPNNLVDRWSEFEAKETDTIWFDFGGMMRVNTPDVKEKIWGVEFGMPVTHLPIFIEALDSERLNLSTYWQCSSRFHNYVFSKKVRDRLRYEFGEKMKVYDEMIEGFNKDMDDVILHTDKVISLKKYHKGGK